MVRTVTDADRIVLQNQVTRDLRTQFAVYHTMLGSKAQQVSKLCPSYVAKSLLAFLQSIEQWNVDDRIANCSHTFRDSTVCTKCGTSVSLLHA
jgi:hypothetical protein